MVDKKNFTCILSGTEDRPTRITYNALIQICKKRREDALNSSVQIGLQCAKCKIYQKVQTGKIVPNYIILITPEDFVKESALRNNNNVKQTSSSYDINDIGKIERSNFSLPLLKRQQTKKRGENIRRKYCPGCQQYKKITSFHKDPYRKDGYNRLCKSCRNLFRRKAYRKLLEKIKILEKQKEDLLRILDCEFSLKN